MLTLFPLALHGLAALGISQPASPPHAGAGEWSSWDEWIASAGRLQDAAGDGGGWHLSGFLRARYGHSSDVAPDALDTTSELGGFQIDDARIEARASLGDFRVHLALEGTSGAPDTPATYGSGGGAWSMFGDVESTGAMALLDANVNWQLSDLIDLTAGLFLVPFHANAAIREDRMLFLNHSVSGEHWRFRDIGVKVSGDHGAVDWSLALTNGLDAQADELAWFARVQGELLDPDAPSTEGSFGVADARHLQVGAGYYSDDGNTPDDVAWTVDANFVQGAFNAGFELVDYDQGATSIYTNNQQSASVIAGDRTAWVAQGGWRFDPNWEAAARYEDLGDDDETTVATVAINRYLRGHQVKLQLQYSMAESDDGLLEADILALGMTVSL